MHNYIYKYNIYPDCALYTRDYIIYTLYERLLKAAEKYSERMHLSPDHAEMTGFPYRI